jgi:hypothetical protein
MIVGQGLALCYLDPRSVQSGGVVTREEVLNQLASVMGTDALMRTLNPKRKRVDERVMQRTVRQKVNEALRRLGQLGFVELLDGEQLRLAPSLMRFAEPVRGLDAPSDALKRLIERGEVSLGPGDADPEEASGEDASEDPDAEAADAAEEVDPAEAADAAEEADALESAEAGAAIETDSSDAAAGDTLDSREDAPEALDAGDATFLDDPGESGDSLAAFLRDPGESGDSLAAFLHEPDAADAAPADDPDAALADAADHEGEASRRMHLAPEPDASDAEPRPAAPAGEPIELDWDTLPGEEA